MTAGHASGSWPAIARSLLSRARWVSLAVTGHRTAARWRIDATQETHLLRLEGV
jgi:hypothetical protein